MDLKGGMMSLSDKTNEQQELNDYVTGDDVEAISTELIAARLDVYNLLLVIRFQAYISIPLMIGYVLYIGQDIIIPIVIAFVLTYAIMLIADAIETLLNKIRLIGDRSPVPILLSLILILFGSVLFGLVINANITELIAKSHIYHDKLQKLIDTIISSLGVEEHISLDHVSEQLHIGKLISSISQVFMYIFGEAFNILIYTAFLLATWTNFHKVIVSMLQFKGWEPERYLEVRETINRAMKEYINIKIIVSLITAVISYLIMLSVGLDFALFWSLLTFLLNFIPTIGSIVAALIPSLLGVLQFDPGLQAAGLATGLILTQLIVGNVLEPRLMGQSLNLNTFMIVVFLAIWGKLWGIIGMFLCIPIMVMMLLIFKEFAATGIISIGLSGDGQIFHPTEFTKGAMIARQVRLMKARLKSRSHEEHLHNHEDGDPQQVETSDENSSSHETD